MTVAPTLIWAAASAAVMIPAHPVMQRPVAEKGWVGLSWLCTMAPDGICQTGKAEATPLTHARGRHSRDQRDGVLIEQKSHRISGMNGDVRDHPTPPSQDNRSRARPRC